MSAFDALTARLEAAEHGDRQLDWAIREAIATVHIPFNPDPRCWVWIGADGLIYRAAERGGSTNDRYLPFYTTSLDAALTLVPEGAGSWELDWNGHSGATDGKPYCATLYLGASSVQHNGGSATAAVAVCIAALKARAA